MAGRSIVHLQNDIRGVCGGPVAALRRTGGDVHVKEAACRYMSSSGMSISMTRKDEVQARAQWGTILPTCSKDYLLGCVDMRAIRG